MKSIYLQGTLHNQFIADLSADALDSWQRIVDRLNENFPGGSEKAIQYLIGKRPEE